MYEHAIMHTAHRPFYYLSTVYVLCNRIKVCTNKNANMCNEENCADWKTEKTYNNIRHYGIFPLLCDQNFGGLVESPSPPPIISFVFGFFSHVYDLLAMPYLRDSTWIGKNSGDGICMFLYECVKRCAFGDILSWIYISCVCMFAFLEYFIKAQKKIKKWIPWGWHLKYLVHT